MAVTLSFAYCADLVAASLRLPGVQVALQDLVKLQAAQLTMQFKEKAQQHHSQLKNLHTCLAELDAASKGILDSVQVSSSTPFALVNCPSASAYRAVQDCC